MIAADVQIVDVDGAHWANLLALGRRPPVTDGRPRGWLLLFVDGETLVRAVRSDGAPVDAGAIAWRGPAMPLEPIARAAAVHRVVVIERGALGELHRDAEGALGYDQDLVEQLLHILAATRARRGRGIWTWPTHLARFPIPTFAQVQRAFDRLWPDGHTLVYYVIDEEADAPHASLIVAKRGGDVTLITTHLGLGDVPIGRDWRRQHRDVLAAVGHRYGPPFLGYFTSLASHRHVSGGPRGVLAMETMRRNIIVQPIPGWLLTLLGGSAGIGAATAASRLARALPAGMRTRVEALAPFEPLGFDPFALWAAFRDGPEGRS